VTVGYPLLTEVDDDDDEGEKKAMMVMVREQEKGMTSTHLAESELDML
jgi:hypothetical protein